MSSLPEDFYLQECRSKKGEIYYHIKKKGFNTDKNKAHFDYEGHERVDENSLLRRLNKNDISIPQNCEAIIIPSHSLDNLEQMLNEPRFHHLSEYILPYPHCPKKKFIWLGLPGNRRDYDGAIIDLINSSFISNPC